MLYYLIMATRLILILLLVLLPSAAHADTATFTKVKHSWAGKRSASVLLKFEGQKAVNISSAPHGDKFRSFVEIWDGLYLQVFSMGHSRVIQGEWGYSFEFSKDASGETFITPLHTPRHGKTPSTITASDFVDGDKNWPSILGTMYVNAPGELRVIEYQDFRVEIRTLEYETINDASSEVPSFKSYSCLVTVSEIK